LKKLLLRPPVAAIAGRQNSPEITTSSADNERHAKEQQMSTLEGRTAIESVRQGTGPGNGP